MHVALKWPRNRGIRDFYHSFCVFSILTCVQALLLEVSREVMREPTARERKRAFARHSQWRACSRAGYFYSGIRSLRPTLILTYLWRFERIIHRKRNIKVEHSTFVHRFLRTQNRGAPLVKIVAFGTRAVKKMKT